MREAIATGVEAKRATQERRGTRDEDIGLRRSEQYRAGSLIANIIQSQSGHLLAAAADSRQYTKEEMPNATEDNIRDTRVWMWSSM